MPGEAADRRGDEDGGTDDDQAADTQVLLAKTICPSLAAGVIRAIS